MQVSASHQGYRSPLCFSFCPEQASGNRVPRDTRLTAYNHTDRCVDVRSPLNMHFLHYAPCKNYTLARAASKIVLNWTIPILTVDKFSALDRDALECIVGECGSSFFFPHTKIRQSFVLGSSQPKYRVTRGEMNDA